MVKKSLNFSIIVICLAILTFTTIKAQNNIRIPQTEVLPTKNLSADPSITVSPASFVVRKNPGENFKEKISVQTANLSDPQIINKFWEYDSSYQNRNESSLLQKITTINIGNTQELGRKNYDIEIDTKILKNQTYFFGIEFIVHETAKQSGVTGDFGVNVPIILSIDADPNDLNPKPELGLNPSSKFYFTEENIGTTLQVINQSEKLVSFSGELLVVNDKNEIIYTEKIKTENDRLLPKEAISQSITIPKLEGQGILPFTGRLRFLIRGTVNNSRHIETKPIEIYIIPYQIAIALGIFLGIILCGVNVFRNRTKKYK